MKKKYIECEILWQILGLDLKCWGGGKNGTRGQPGTHNNYGHLTDLHDKL